METKTETIVKVVKAVLGTLVPDGRYAAEQFYGDRMNALVVYFPYRRTHEAGVETLDDFMGQVIKADDDLVITEYLGEWLEAEGYAIVPVPEAA